MSAKQTDENKYASDLCDAFNLPKKDCMDTARKWYQHERLALREGSNGSASSSQS